MHPLQGPKREKGIQYGHILISLSSPPPILTSVSPATAQGGCQPPRFSPASVALQIPGQTEDQAAAGPHCYLAVDQIICNGTTGYFCSFAPYDSEAPPGVEVLCHWGISPWFMVITVAVRFISRCRWGRLHPSPGCWIDLLSDGSWLVPADWTPSPSWVTLDSCQQHSVGVDVLIRSLDIMLPSCYCWAATLWLMGCWYFLALLGGLHQHGIAWALVFLLPLRTEWT